MKEMCSVKDMVVVISGGAGLLGREFAKACAENGAVAVIADINPQKAAEAAEYAGTPYFFETDINSEASVNSLVETLDKKFGRIDGLVNSAYPRNKNYGRHFFDVTHADFCENVSLHLGGFFLMSQKFAAYFKARGKGCIINLASIYGVTAPDFSIYDGTTMTMPVEYAAFKSGIIHMTKYMAVYLKGTGVRVNCISPGGILDGQPESFLVRYRNKCLNKGMLDRTDISGTVLYLLSDMSSVVNGQNIVADDGFCL